MTRPCIVAGNWKMHKTVAETERYLSALAPQVAGLEARVYVAVPATALAVAAKAATGSPVVIGAQNMHDADSGAFTGEVSGRMIQEAGGRFVILGHSERRHLFGESDSFINSKVLKALAIGLQPVFCCGETLAQREEGAMEAVLSEQIAKGLESVTAEQLMQCVVAYEPVWAIGTGKTATPEQAQEAHRYVRERLREGWGDEAASRVVIQYGGSVKPDNAAELLALADVDGVLVGGASLEADSFAAIAKAYAAETQITK